MQSGASSTEVLSIVSKLFGPEGIPRTEFEALFLLCDGCDRVMPKIGQAEHKCLIEAPSDDSEFEDDVDSVMIK